MKFLGLIILLSLGIFGFSQNVEFEKKYRQAKRYYYHNNYAKAEQYMLECYRIDSTNVDLLKLLNELSARQKRWKRVAVFSHKLQGLLPSEATKYYRQEILSYFNLEAYTDAEKVLNACLKNQKLDAFEAKSCQRIANNIAFAKEAIEHPVLFSPENLGKEINSSYAEYLPNLTQDGRYLIYTRMVNRSMSFPSLQEDFYISKKEKSEWLKSVPLSQTINTDKNEGAPSISADGKVLYFAACNRSDCEGNCDIYYSYNRGNYWTSPKNLKVVNTKYWESQPHLSADGKTLFFVSDRPGGEGGKDIWAVDILFDNSWGEPYNLGKQINTNYDEISPFLHFDNKTLYFASDGWPGMGNKDIFVSRKLADKTWTRPKNLGYPINSSETDNSFFVDASGTTAYFSSRRKGGYGKEDIYKFTLYEGIRPQKIVHYKALVLDANTKQFLDVKYQVIPVNDTIVALPKETANGQLLLSLDPDKEYQISVFKSGYLYFSDLIDSLVEKGKSSIERKIFLKPITQNEQFELKNITFDFDKATLKASSTQELSLFSEYLKQNPRMIICIEGHTDNKGSVQYNLDLSLQRARIVKEYLVVKGIQDDRIQIKGFGSSQIISKQKQEKNRRVVVRIIKN